MKTAALLKITIAFIALAAIAMLSPPPAQALDISRFALLKVSINTDSDLSAAFKPYDQRGDAFLQTGLELGGRMQASLYDSFKYTFELENRAYREYYGLNRTSAGLALAWQHKYGIGRTAPFTVLEASAGRREFNDPERDATHFDATLTAVKIFNGGVSLSARFNMESWTGGNDTFNGNRYTAGISVGVPLPRSFHISVGYAQMRGDIAWHCSGFTIPIPPSSHEDVFDLYAYRRPSRTRMISSTLSYPLNNSTTAFITVERHDTVWSYKSYPNDILRAGMVHRLK